MDWVSNDANGLFYHSDAWKKETRWKLGHNWGQDVFPYELVMAIRDQGCQRCWNFSFLPHLSRLLATYILY